jgi:hypothetical protein
LPSDAMTTGGAPSRTGIFRPRLSPHFIFHYFPTTLRFAARKCRQTSVLGLTRGTLARSTRNRGLMSAIRSPMRPKYFTLFRKFAAMSGTAGERDSNAVPFPRPLLLLGDAGTFLVKRKPCPKKLCQSRVHPRR